MPFRTLSFRETQGQVRWEVSWDGHLDQQPLEQRGSFWTGSVGIRYSPNSDGSQTVEALQVIMRHTQGPHLDDRNPSYPTGTDVDPLDLLSEMGSRNWGTWAIPHPRSGGRGHRDGYTLESRRAADRGVVLLITGDHTEAPAEAEPGQESTSTTSGGDQPATTPGGSQPPATTPAQPAAPATAPPRRGSPRDYVFIEETTDDNGYDWWAGFWRTGEVYVDSVEAMVDHITSTLGEDECIRSITIIGHGTNGYLAMGNGQSGGDVNKGLYFNGGPWEALFRRLTCKFCENSVVTLRGCNVGAGTEGAQLLFRVSQILECAATVRAWTGYCYPTSTTGEEQSVGRGAGAPPAPLTPVVPGSGKKKKGGAVTPVPLVAGTRKKTMMFRPHDIVEARFLPRLLGRPFSEKEVEAHGAPLDARSLGILRSWAAASEVDAAPLAGLALDGYLQLKVRNHSGQVDWVPSWGVVSGGRCLSPMRGDTSFLYVLPDPLAEVVSALVSRANAAWTP